MKRLAFLLLAALVGCALEPTLPVKDQRTIYTSEPWRECDRLFGTFGRFLDAAGCYRILRESGRWVCYKVVGMKPQNPSRQDQTERHETRHCEEGDFHKGELQERVLLLF